VARGDAREGGAEQAEVSAREIAWKCCRRAN
jgi:hypothetical protein